MSDAMPYMAQYQSYMGHNSNDLYMIYPLGSCPELAFQMAQFSRRILHIDLVPMKLGFTEVLHRTLIIVILSIAKLGREYRSLRLFFITYNIFSLTAPTQPVTDPILNESSATMADQLSVCPDISLFDPDSYRDRECEDYNLHMVSNLDFIRFCMISGNTSGRDRQDQLSGVFFSKLFNYEIF